LSIQRVRTFAMDAEHEAFSPPFVPEQVQDQGPVPANEATVPEEQRFAEVTAREATVVPLVVPQTPGRGAAETMMVTLFGPVVPPGPEQVRP